MDFWQLLFDIVLILGGSTVFGAVAARFGQSPIVGYLLAGMILGGPGSAHLITSEKEMETISEIGVSLLLFSLGLEFSWQHLKSFGSRILLTGALQVTITLAVGSAIALALGTSAGTAVAIGAMVSVSSTACVLRVLFDLGQLDSAHGRNSVAILLTQDLAIVPLAIILTLLGQQGTFGEAMLKVGEILILTLVLVFGLYLLVNRIAVSFLRAFSLDRHRELAILLAVTFGLGSAWAAHKAGISPALGGFICGMFLGSSPFALQVRTDVTALRTILLTLFFGSAGMVADPLWMFQNFFTLFSTAALIIGVKAVIVTILLRLMRQQLSIAIASGLVVGQIGEFALVLGGIAKTSGLIAEDIEIFMVSCAIVTLLLTPYLISVAPKVGRFIDTKLGRSAYISGNGQHDGERASVVIIGYGPAGQIAASALSHLGRSLQIIDLNEEAQQLAREAGFSFSLADATNSEVLQHARVGEASVIVVTIPDREASSQVIRNARRLAPDAFIIARSRLNRDVPLLIQAGANVAVDEEQQMGLRLSKEVSGMVSEKEA